jgi:endonuclease-3
MPSETDAERRKRARVITNRLRKAHPDTGTALHHSSPLELLVATILSAQCTDERVNKVTPALFARYPTAADLADADRAELEELVRTTGFYRNKAKSVQGAGRKIVEEFGGEVPRTMEELLKLPGVARKTANVVLGNYFGIAAGVVVDTHVFRLAHRMGFTTSKNTGQVERDLMGLAPEKDWIDLGNLLIRHGRSVCTARRPKCEACTVESHCPKVDVDLAPNRNKAEAPRSRTPLGERIRAARKIIKKSK